MQLTAFHKARGDAVVLSHSPYRSLAERPYDRVYGAAIFSFSARRVERLRAEFPGAVVGRMWDPINTVTVEDVIGQPAMGYDGTSDTLMRVMRSDDHFGWIPALQV